MRQPLLAADIQRADDPARTLAERREAEIRKAVLAALLGLSGALSGAAAERSVGDRGAMKGLQPIAGWITEAYKFFDETAVGGRLRLAANGHSGGVQAGSQIR